MLFTSAGNPVTAIVSQFAPFKLLDQFHQFVTASKVLHCMCSMCQRERERGRERARERTRERERETGKEREIERDSDRDKKLKKGIFSGKVWEKVKKNVRDERENVSVC